MPLVEDKLAKHIGGWLKNLPRETQRIVVKEGSWTPETVPMHAVELESGIDTDTLAVDLAMACQSTCDANEEETRFWIEAQRADKKLGTVAIRRLPLYVKPAHAEKEAEEEKALGAMQILERTNAQMIAHTEILMKHQTEHMGNILTTQSHALVVANEHENKLAREVEKLREANAATTAALEKTLAMLEAKENGEEKSPDERRKDQMLEFGMMYGMEWLKKQMDKAEAAANGSSNGSANGASEHAPDSSAASDEQIPEE